jgi:hypothetical protein
MKAKKRLDAINNAPIKKIALKIATAELPYI